MPRSSRADVAVEVVEAAVVEAIVTAAEMIIGTLAIIIGIRDRMIACPRVGQTTRTLLYVARTIPSTRYANKTCSWR